MINIGINGLGRIGRHVFKCIADKYSDKMQVSAVNDLAPGPTCAHLLKHDSIYGAWQHMVFYDEENLIIDDKKVKKFSRSKPSDIDWASFDVDIVVESTGHFRKIEDLKSHMQGSVKKVVVSAPAKGEDITLVPGVNLDWYDHEKHNIISSASCTTNCVAQIIKHVNDGFGIKLCSFVTIHAYSNDQSIIDQPHSDLRRARALAFNIIPTTTGASAAIEKVLPQLKGKILAGAYRVPVHCGSLVDCTFILEKEVSVETINDYLEKQATGINGRYMAFSKEPLVSADFCRDSHSCIVDGMLTETLGNTARLVGWYDNEWSYSLRVCDILMHISESL